MLWIVLKFDDIVCFVVTAHQLGLRAASHPPHMLDGQLHGRHASHARRNPQENCSGTGSENCLKGNLWNVHRIETGPGGSLKDKPKARMNYSGPRSANHWSVDPLTWKAVSAFCRA